MKYILILLLFFTSCKKEQCKSVTKMVVNGYTNTTTYPLKDITMCGSDLVAIRKQNNTFIDIHVGGATYRITTFIIEK